MDTRNYKEDQNNEIEALDSIYCGEMDSKTWFLKKWGYEILIFFIIPCFQNSFRSWALSQI